MDFGISNLDFGILEFGFWTLDFGFGVWDFGVCNLDSGDSGLWTLNSEFGFWVWDFGFRILAFGFGWLYLGGRDMLFHLLSVCCGATGARAICEAIVSLILLLLCFKGL